MYIRIIVMRCGVEAKKKEWINAEDSWVPLSPSVSALLVLNKSSNDDYEKKRKKRNEKEEKTCKVIMEEKI